jgi:hypothetical protein
LAVCKGGNRDRTAPRVGPLRKEVPPPPRCCALLPLLTLLRLGSAPEGRENVKKKDKK